MLSSRALPWINWGHIKAPSPLFTKYESNLMDWLLVEGKLWTLYLEVSSLDFFLRLLYSGRKNLVGHKDVSQLTGAVATKVALLLRNFRITRERGDKENRSWGIVSDWSLIGNKRKEVRGTFVISRLQFHTREVWKKISFSEKKLQWHMKYEGDGRYMGVVVWSKVDFNFMDAYLKSAIF